MSPFYVLYYQKQSLARKGSNVEEMRCVLLIINCILTTQFANVN